jgi:putative tryptophan/tyrosine transport system substrate-binding protein
MNRREFIAGLGGTAVAWPLAARAQQGATQTIGSLGTLETRREVVAAVHRGLSETGYVEGRNLAVEYRWAPEDALDRLPDLALDLVNRRVAVIVALQTPAVVAAKSRLSLRPVSIQ